MVLPLQTLLILLLVLTISLSDVGDTMHLPTLEEGRLPALPDSRARARLPRSPPERRPGSPGPASRRPGPEVPPGGPQEEGPGGGNVSWAYRHVSWSLEEFPNPRRDPTRCGRRQPSMVCDPNRLLTRSEARKLDRATTAICAQSGCACERNCSESCPGFKVGVAIIPSLNGDFRSDNSGQSGDGELASWAHTLRTQVWKLDTCSDDIIVVLEMNEMKVAVSVGDQAAEKLTKTCRNSIYKDAQRHLLADRAAPALIQMLKDIRLTFEDNFKCVISFSEAMSTGKVIGIIFASVGPVVLVVVIMIFLGPCFRGRGFGGSTGAKNRSYHHRRGYEPAETAMDGPPLRGAVRGDDFS